MAQMESTREAFFGFDFRGPLWEKKCSIFQFGTAKLVESSRTESSEGIEMRALKIHLLMEGFLRAIVGSFVRRQSASAAAKYETFNSQIFIERARWNINRGRKGRQIAGLDGATFCFPFELRSRRYSKSFVTSTSAGGGRARIKTSTRPVNKQFDHRMAREARNHCRGSSLVVGNKCTIVADIWSRAPRHAGTYHLKYLFSCPNWNSNGKKSASHAHGAASRPSRANLLW